MKKLIIFAVCCTVATLIQLSAASASNTGDLSCPVWTIPHERDGIQTCWCGNYIQRIVTCDPATLNLSIALFHCMTYSEVLNTTVVGPCFHHSIGEADLHCSYTQLPKLYHRNDNLMCHFPEYCLSRDCVYYRHQTGLMCTSCEEGYAYPVYSYSIGCVKCTDYKYNWLKYIAVAFLPLTVFYILVVMFRITATSGAMNGYVLICQLMTVPSSTIVLSRVGRPVVTGIYFTFLGIWNLDFFRGLYAPFCLQPKLTALQTLMLDYVVAVYPLLLVILTYIFVKLHNRYCFVVKLWSPFYKCFALFRNNWDIKGSLVGAFATFLLLSYVKILNISFIILIPNTLYDINGNQTPKRFLTYDASYEFLGLDHLPYALLALFMVVVFNVFPLVLLCLYPCHWFQRCLNCCRLRCLSMHIFMDTFHGCYKLQPRDCRHFAALYVFLRFLNLTFAALYIGSGYLPFVGATFLIMSVLVATVRPYKITSHTIVDTIFFALSSLFTLGISNFQAQKYETMYFRILTYSLMAPLVFLLLLYGLGLVIYFMVPKNIIQKVQTLFQRCKSIIGGKADTAETAPTLPYRFDHSDEYPPLLPMIQPASFHDIQ